MTFAAPGQILSNAVMKFHSASFKNGGILKQEEVRQLKRLVRLSNEPKENAMPTQTTLKALYERRDAVATARNNLLCYSKQQSVPHFVLATLGWLLLEYANLTAAIEEEEALLDKVGNPGTMKFVPF